MGKIGAGTVAGSSPLAEIVRTTLGRLKMLAKSLGLVVLAAGVGGVAAVRGGGSMIRTMLGAAPSGSVRGGGATAARSAVSGVFRSAEGETPAASAVAGTQVLIGAVGATLGRPAPR